MMMKFMRHILVASVITCVTLGVLFYRTRFQPLRGTYCDYEIRRGTEVWKRTSRGIFHASDVFVHPVAPPERYGHLWISIHETTEEENSGIVLFSEQGEARVFISLQDAAAVTAVSCSPQGRVIAVLREPRQKIDFFSYPEIQYTGTINAVGPILWKDPRSGAACTPDRKMIAFSMIPRDSTTSDARK